MNNDRVGVTGFTKRTVLQHGRRYIPAAPPADLKDFPPGKCFDGAWMNAYLTDGRYTYVEGLALNPDTHDEWIHHAWVTDGVHAYDPTWHRTVNATGEKLAVTTVYIGIPMDMMAVARFVKGTNGYVSVMGNRHRNKKLPDLALRSII